MGDLLLQAAGEILGSCNKTYCLEKSDLSEIGNLGRWEERTFGTFAFSEQTEIGWQLSFLIYMLVGLQRQTEPLIYFLFLFSLLS